MGMLNPLHQSLYQAVALGNLAVFRETLSLVLADSTVTSVVLQPIEEAAQATSTDLANNFSPNRLSLFGDIIAKSGKETRSLFRTPADVLKTVRQAVRSVRTPLTLLQKPGIQMPDIHDPSLKQKVEELLKAVAKPKTQRSDIDKHADIAKALCNFFEKDPIKVIPKADAEPFISFLVDFYFIEQIPFYFGTRIGLTIDHALANADEKHIRRWREEWISAAQDPASLSEQEKWVTLLSLTHTHFVLPDEKRIIAQTIFRTGKFSSAVTISAWAVMLGTDVSFFQDEELAAITKRLALESLGQEMTISIPKEKAARLWQRKKEGDWRVNPEVFVQTHVRRSLRSLFTQLPRERQEMLYNETVRALPEWWAVMSKESKSTSLQGWLEWLTHENY